MYTILTIIKSMGLDGGIYVDMIIRKYIEHMIIQ